MPATVSGHIGIAGAHISVPRGPWRHAVAPVAARIACPYAHLMPRCLAAPVITLPLAVWILVQYAPKASVTTKRSNFLSFGK